MNASTFRLLIPMLNAPTPQQWPEDLRPPEGDDVRLPEPAVVEIGEGAARRLRELVETPEPPTGHNLCGGTMQTLDPLAYDGWSDKPCPGCDGCRDAEPPVVGVLTEEEFVRAFEARMQQVGEYDDQPTFRAPPRGRVVSQAEGPNRKQRRARR
jgi:hypothetical protein